MCTPVLQHGLTAAAIARQQRELLDAFLVERGIAQFLSWYYTPMAREFSRHLQPVLTVYDCMDELSAFAGAPPAMSFNERELFESAAVVFTGGASLYEAKRQQHVNVRLYPSSVDVQHFSAARRISAEPQDQAAIPHPRIGYAGVIDERMDIGLLAAVAEQRPDWHFVMLGPVVKIDPESLPQAPNIHYLGMKSYTDLPAYLSGWKIGMLPFARNESTRYISPTKTPEYLAAGLSVISTPIQDVVKPYQELGLVAIADRPDEFIAAGKRLLDAPDERSRLGRADAFLARNSWDKTWSAMGHDISDAIEKKISEAKENVPALLTSPMLMKGAAHV